MKPFEKIKQSQKLLEDARQELGAFLQSETGRRRGEALRQLHAITGMLTEANPYFSQAGQDRVVDRLLEEKTGGVFVDVGGYDGIIGSNTLFFEAFRKWSGILIEPSPTQLAKAQVVRRCACLGYAIAGEQGTADFMEITEGFTQMSGFLESYDADLLARVRGDTRHREVIHQLEKKTLAAVLEEQNLRQIDFLSLDVEGGEMEILSGFPFADFEVTMWSIENNSQSSDLPELMRGQGYALVEFAGVDDIFKKIA
jgi:FkbM family methyltransferase